MKKGKLFLIVGPSGVGKGTLIAELKKQHPEYIFTLSVTTRKMRPGEKEGEVYHFLSKEEFHNKIENNELLEWAVVHQDNMYGTLKKPILDGIAEGKTVIREIDIQGLRLAEKCLTKDELVSIFIMPPNMEALRERILSRSPMEHEELFKRMESAQKEIDEAKFCDYQVISEKNQVEKLVKDVEKIIEENME